MQPSFYITPVFDTEIETEDIRLLDLPFDWDHLAEKKVLLLLFRVRSLLNKLDIDEENELLRLRRLIHYLELEVARDILDRLWTYDRIKYLRFCRNESQVAFAAQIGANNDSVSHWERGVTRPQLKHLVALTRLEMESAKRVLPTEDPGIARELAGWTSTADLQSLMTDVGSLPEEVVTALETARTVLEKAKELAELGGALWPMPVLSLDIKAPAGTINEARREHKASKEDPRKGKPARDKMHPFRFQGERLQIEFGKLKKVG